METDLLFYLNGTYDLTLVSYKGYAAIKKNMENDFYVKLIPPILRLVYLSPLPLPVPPAQNSSGTVSAQPPSVVASQNSRNVSPWTIGACVATIMGGLISIVIWSKNRRSRHRRHVQLLEEVPHTKEPTGHSLLSI